MSARRARVKAAQEPLSLLAFGARWCAPWLLLQPALERLEQDGVTIRRVDVDEDEAAAERHRVISLPTLIVMRGGEERRRLLGAVSESDLRLYLKRD